ncbi:MAG TPA: hypothetical protein VJ867_06545 [Gemmatimonadaceae bacterium]|nr:hypothetical protein [Gemmatimonadaceae bacterium]
MRRVALHRAVVAGALLLVASVPARAQVPQGSSLVTEMMVRGRNSLNDLRYHEADSIGRRVLLLGSLLTKQQRVDALQLVAAASYPDEQPEQHPDSAITVIKQLVELGATQGIPRDLSWPGLDSLFSFVVRAAQPAKVLLGSRIPGSVLYVDGQPQGVIQGLRVVLVPPGKDVQLSVRADGCTAWDSTVVTQAADSIRVGFRNPRCSK